MYWTWAEINMYIMTSLFAGWRGPWFGDRVGRGHSRPGGRRSALTYLLKSIGYKLQVLARLENVYEYFINAKNRILYLKRAFFFRYIYVKINSYACIHKSVFEMNVFTMLSLFKKKKKTGWRRANDIAIFTNGKLTVNISSRTWDMI